MYFYYLKGDLLTHYKFYFLVIYIILPGLEGWICWNIMLFVYLEFVNLYGEFMKHFLVFFSMNKFDVNESSLKEFKNNIIFLKFKPFRVHCIEVRRMYIFDKLVTRFLQNYWVDNSTFKKLK